jgi:hypothetical protein
MNYSKLGIHEAVPMEYRYCGPEHQPQRLSGHAKPLTLQNALTVIQTAWRDGRVHVSSHIKERFAERGVDMLDLQNIVRTGRVVSFEESPEYRNWKYRMEGISDGKKLSVIFALDFTEDLAESPLVIPVTVFLRDSPEGARK